MVALTGTRATARRNGEDFGGPAAANAIIFEGALVARNAAGDVVPGSVATTLKACGVAQASINNTGGAAGAQTVPYKKGVFVFANEATDAITKADVENNAFIFDDQTVARTNGGSTRSIAGRIVDVDAVGVWVRVGI